MKGRITFSCVLSFFILVSTSIIQAQVETLWMKTFGNEGPNQRKSVQQTTDGGYITAGSSRLIKTDANGDTVWIKPIGGYSVQQTTDGGYIIAGTHLVKTNTDGDTIWTKPFGSYSVQQTTDDGYIIVGGSGDVLLTKTDASGDTIWTKTFGGDLNDCGFSVQQTTDEGYIIVGITNSLGAGGDDIWLIKTNSSGDTLWTKTFGGIENDFGSSVQQTIDGGYIIVSHTLSYGANYGDIWLIKTNASGDTTWTKTFGGSFEDWGFSVQQTTDEGYIIVGFTYSFAYGENDVWLIKTNSYGDTLWTETFWAGLEWDAGNSVQQTADGGYIIVGWTMSYIDFPDGAILLIKTTPDPSVIEQKGDITPLDYSLKQNYPNPFNASTNIEFRIPKSGYVTLKIFNILGEEVTTLVSGQLLTGNYSYGWDASNLASGVYLYRLSVGSLTGEAEASSPGLGQGFVETRKMVVLR